jgi:membrane-associated phospholipid phosphatase
MVAVSRIFVGKHYLGDVIVGSVTGCLAGIAFGYLGACLIRRLTKSSEADA